MRNIFCYILSFALISSLCSQKIVEKANTAYNKKEFSEAIPLYKEALITLKNKSAYKEAIIHLGNCYYYLNDIDNALKYYEKCYKEGYAKPEIYYHMGNVLLKKGEYEDAKEFLDLYLENKPEDERVKALVKACRFALKNRSSIPNLVIKNEEDLNSPYAEYGLAELNNSLIFSSSRIIKDFPKIYKVTGQSYNEFYETQYDTSRNVWKIPMNIKGQINTPYNEGTCVYDKNSNILYFMLCNGLLGNTNTCNIYYSIYNKLNNIWSEPKILPLTNEEFNQGHPAITSDGKTLYFVSDMPGGEGNKDIWFSEKKEDNTWTEPRNAGRKINTPCDEMFPYVYKDSLLYFSSDGLPGYGGLDIFYAPIQKNGIGKPENVMLPINSCADDFGVLIFKEDSGMLSSNRTGGVGDDDIYSFFLKQKEFTIEGYIKDRNNNIPLNNALIMLSSNDIDFDSTRSDNNGSYKFSNVKTGKDYAITVHKKGYLGEIKYVEPKSSLTNNIRDSIENMKFNMILLTDEEININNIYYDFGKWNITSESRIELMHLVDLLKVNPAIKIRINSHTDDVGDEEFNMELSRYRAQSVVNYLIEKGVDPERLSYKGYGESQPYLKNANTEDERKQNRRTTFQIVNLDDIDLSYNPAEYKQLAQNIIVDREKKKQYTDILSEPRKEIIFRLQIYAGKERISKSYRNEISQYIGRYKIISSKGKDGYYRYAIGDFKKFEQAMEVYKILQENNYQSFVIAFMNNLRITILEARQLSEKYSNY